MEVPKAFESPRIVSLRNALVSDKIIAALETFWQEIIVHDSPLIEAISWLISKWVDSTRKQ